MQDRQLITDIYLFPRCEYYSRFVGTTAYAMDNPKHWGTYYRSQKSRISSAIGGRNKLTFKSPCVENSDNSNSFYAHTGGYVTPFTQAKYMEKIQLTHLAPQNEINVRDALLLYKRKMAEIVVKSFESFSANAQRIGIDENAVRPIVFYENDYHCVLIKLPILNPLEFSSEATKYWAVNPTSFQKLLLASFIAILNVKALKSNIPIEMVIRASFSHNLPSICETNNTFRINTGIVPQAYAELIGEALHDLNEMVNTISDESSLLTSFNKKFLDQVKKYNVKKLKMAIDSKPRYVKLIKTRNYKKAAKSHSAFEKLYAAKKEIDDVIRNNEGKAKYYPVDLQNKKIWKAIRGYGDSSGNSVLLNCFRKNQSLEWFANVMMKAIVAEKKKPLEYSLNKLLSCLVYAETVTMNYDKIRRDLKSDKWEFNDLSFTRFYESDPEFSVITNILFQAFLNERSEDRLYENLERAGCDFSTTYRGSENIGSESDYGSDSEVSEDYTAVCEETDEFMYVEDFHLSHEKLRVCGGMKSIVLAQYGALAYLRNHGMHQAYRQDIEQMYYEVKGAIKCVVDKNKQSFLENKIRADEKSGILHFDLKHCNASNSPGNKTLLEKLSAFKSSVVILDYSSSTENEIQRALAECFVYHQIDLVILAASGLKNDQGGDDRNPYGELRVCARTMAICDDLLEKLKTGLSEQDKLSPTAHEMVRACKNRGLAFSFKRKLASVSNIVGEDIPDSASHKKVKLIHDFANSRNILLNNILPFYFQCMHKLNDYVVNCLTIHPSGAVIIGGDDGKMEMWDKTMENRIKVFQGHFSYVKFISILPNENILSVYHDNAIKEWDVKSGECVNQMQFNDKIESLTALGNGNFLVSIDQSLQEYNFEMGQQGNDIDLDGALSSMLVFEDTVISATYTDSICLLEEWDKETGDIITAFKGHTDQISCLILHSNGNIISGSYDKTVREWNRETGKCVRTYLGHREVVTCLAVLPNGNIISGSEDSKIKVWDKNTEECLETLSAHTGSISHLAILADGSILSAGDEDNLKIWKLTNNIQARLNQSHPGIDKQINMNDTPHGFFHHTRVINQYPKSNNNNNNQYLQDYLINCLIKGDEEQILKLENSGASFLLPNSQGLYPIPAAVSALNIKMLKCIESKLPQAEIIRQWQLVDVEKVREKIAEILEELTDSKHHDEYGKWYILDVSCDSKPNLEESLRDIYQKKDLFIENCLKWCIDIDGLRKGFDKYVSSDGVDPIGYIVTYGSTHDLYVYEAVIKDIRKVMYQFIDEINSKVNLVQYSFDCKK